MSRHSSISQPLSPSSTSSFDYLSAQSGSLPRRDSLGVLSDDLSLSSDDVDDIVWPLSDLSLSSTSNPRRPSPRGVGARSPTTFSDEDFIVLSRPRTPARSAHPPIPTVTSPSALESPQHLRRLSSASSASSDASAPPSPNRRAKKAAKRAAAALETSSPTARGKPNPKKSQPKAPQQPTRSLSPEVAEALRTAKAAVRKAKAAKKSPPSSPTKSSKEASAPAPRAPAHRASTPPAPATRTNDEAGLGDRAIVDDMSEAGDSGFSAYHDAVEYISSFLSDPKPKPQAKSDLTLLQALIIELGLCQSPPSLPNSLSAARALLKSNVFLNIRDYLAVRGEGLDALRNVMHPSRVSLMREVRAGKRAPLQWVKASGLNVLLVQCF